MEERVLDFVRGLRSRGVPVSVSESLDALRALVLVGVERPEAVKAALRSTLVKRRRDGEIFDELFPLYFYGLESPPEEGEDEALRGKLEQALQQWAGERNGVVGLLTMILTGGGGEWENIVRTAAGEVGTASLTARMQVGMFTMRIYEHLPWAQLEKELVDFLSFLERRGWDEGERKGVEEAFERKREAFRRLVRRYVEREQAKNAGRLPGEERVESLMDRPLSSLDEMELRQMREVVDVLARKLRNRISMRERRVRRGKLDVRATLRRNMQHGGIPFHLVLRKRRIEKAELMVLCDVSSSVARVSQFMLQFVYSVQDCLSKVRSFVFVDELGEVTDFFRERDIDEGIRMALGNAGISYMSRSDFGEVFRLFCRDYLQDVGYRTYIMIIGDARNNYNDPCAWALEKMSERAKGIIWLNPETRPFWDTGDSVMSEYLPYCREVRVCRTLRDLERAIGSLLL